MEKEKIFGGAFLILCGIALIINKLGYFSDINIFTILLTAFLVYIIIKSLLKVNFPGILFPIAFLCIIYDKQLGITAITPWTVLIAALLGSIGLSMIFNKHPKLAHSKSDWDSYEFKTIDTEDESHIKLQTSFSGSIKYINTDKFEQADLKCSFGAMKVYFDNAILHEGKGVARIESSFSGVELYIPRNWTVEDRANISFGAISEKNRNEGTSDNILTICGNINFSGVEIIYI
jgi:predicted membrane protein